MAITSKAVALQSLFLMGRFEPAVAQRSYEWDEKQWKELFNDLTGAFATADLDPGDPARPELEDSSEHNAAPPAAEIAGDMATTPARMRIVPLQGAPPSTYFLGQMVLWPRRGDAGFLIYDGQQRLTTLTLLLCAIRDIQSQIADWQPLQELIRTERKLVRLTLGSGSKLAAIVDGLGMTAYPANFRSLAKENQQLYHAANYFKSRLKEWSERRVQAFVRFLRENVTIVATEISDRRLAQTAYVTLNTRGMPLSSADILKGHLAQFVAQHSLVRSNEVVKQWDALASRAGDRLERFLKAADFHWFGRYRASDFGLEIMDQFREEADVDIACAWVNDELPRLYELYEEINEHQGMPKFDGMPLRFRRLSFLPWNYWEPLALVILEKFPRMSKDRAVAVRELERWCFTVNLLGWNDEQIAERVATGIEALRSNRNPFLGGNPLFVTKVQKIQARRRLGDGQFDDRQRRRAHLLWLETHLWPGEPVPKRAIHDVKVEHVLPRRPSGQWAIDFPNNIAIYAEKIGNLVLVPHDNLKAEQFDTKREAYSAYDPVHRSVRDVGRYEKWNAEAVDERTSRLLELVAVALAI